MIDVRTTTNERNENISSVALQRYESLIDFDYFLIFKG